MGRHRGQSSWWWFWPITTALGVIETVLITCAIMNANGMI